MIVVKQKMSGLTLAPFGDGRFEVFVDDKLVFSKLASGDFPDPAKLAAKIKSGA